ncbi:MAG: GNAT family N-acetyltransferase [Candidatus Bathyarchaeota archaeon]|nr:GNAT family N-acetyltransferase [Candidatus Bathyarchaeota archaeon]
MRITSRGYTPDLDFPKVQEFLFEVHKETGTFQNWLPTRFENNHMDQVEDIRIWEEEGAQRRVMAVANPETKTIYFIQIRPGHPTLLDTIIRWIETHTASKKPNPAEEQKIHIINIGGDMEREAALRKRGFERGPVYGILRVRDLDTPIPDAPVPEGFTIRSVRGREDYEKLAANIRTVFGHGEWFTADTLEGIARGSFYIRDLDLVAEAPDGAIASFCTFRVDPVSRATELEPMGTHPDYRGLGLAKSLISEGMRRLKDYDPLLLYIDGAADNPGANRLYEATGFVKKGTYFYWSKMI